MNTPYRYFQIRDISPAGFDCVIDATGVAPVVESLFDHVGWAGKVLLLGSCPLAASIQIHPRHIQRREITLLGSFSFGDEFEPALQLLCEGAVDATPILTHSYPLESFVEALAVARSGGRAIKAAFTPA